MLFNPFFGIDESKHGIGFQPDAKSPVAWNALVVHLLVQIHASGFTPLKWHLSMGAPLSKNPSGGPAGFRVVHILPGARKKVAPS